MSMKDFPPLTRTGGCTDFYTPPIRRGVEKTWIDAAREQRQEEQYQPSE